MTATKNIVLLGPAPPYRGGISDTQLQLALALEHQKQKVFLTTFTHLYPSFLFPGKTQYQVEQNSDTHETQKLLHAYNPTKWYNAVAGIKKLHPDMVIFRYYTPFLAPIYSFIARNLKNTKKIALVDNWWPHERKPWDRLLNRYFGRQMDGFATLSSLVGEHIELEKFQKPLFKGFHPIANNLPNPLSQAEARIQLGWPKKIPIVLFYGLIRPYKGLDLLLKAFAEDLIKKSSIVLAVVGECYEDENKYIQLIKGLGLKDKVLVQFTYANQKTTQNVFSAANVVAQTYKTATQSGVTPLAYHFEKPLLVSDIDGLREPIIRDQTGILIQKNPKAIAKGIEQILEPQQLKTFQKNLNLKKKNYRWSSFAKKLLDFEREI